MVDNDGSETSDGFGYASSNLSISEQICFPFRGPRLHQTHNILMNPGEAQCQIDGKSNSEKKEQFPKINRVPNH